MQIAAGNSSLRWRREVGRINTAAEGKSMGLYSKARVRKTGS